MTQRDGIVVGAQLLEIVTSGMYNDPKMVLREYVQNSCDAIDLAVERGVLRRDGGRVDIVVDGTNRRLVVEDNGVGIPNEDVWETLCSVGRSTKDGRTARGFRGIGRLGGIGYCAKVVFETRSRLTESVGRVVWDCRKLVKSLGGLSGQRRIEDILREVVDIEYIPGPKVPARFFRVKLEEVERYHKDELMNPRVVSGYISRSLPVPYDYSEFQFAPAIEQHVSVVEGYRAYKIFLNGKQVLRPYTTVFALRDGKTDYIRDVSLFEIRGSNGTAIGKGWFAITGFLSSLPRESLMKGLTVRQGNIVVGDEGFLDEIYKERRFGLWHIGEIHVDYRLRLNARRDDFEQSDQSEKFKEQTTLLGNRLSKLCRATAMQRYGKKAVSRRAEQIVEGLRTSMFVSEDHRVRAIEEAQLFAQSEDTTRLSNDVDVEEILRLIDWTKKNGCLVEDLLDGRKYRHTTKKEIIAGICKTIYRNIGSVSLVHKIVHECVRPYVRKQNGKCR